MKRCIQNSPVAFVVLVSFALSCEFCLAVHASGSGRDIFEAHCVVCHGTDGSGKNSRVKKLEGADLRSEAVQKLSDKQLFEGIAYGAGHKQYPHAFAYRHVTREEINDVIQYIRTFQKPNSKK
jgi:mono/diheme cytochrome c family protein